MFILTFPNEKIQEILANKDNFEKLKKSIAQIEEPFNKYPEADFSVSSVLNNNEEQALKSFDRFGKTEDVLAVVDFPKTKKGLTAKYLSNSKEQGFIFLEIDDKAALYSNDDIPFKGKNRWEAFRGTWDEVISEYRQFLKDRIDI